MSSNGLSVVENVRYQNAKGRTAPATEPVLSKCPSHPTKRQFSDDGDAVREAKSRSIAAGMPIVAYRCDGCGMAHLCKKEHARAGSILKMPVAEIRALPPAAAIQLGNRAARLKAAAEYLADHKWPTSDEIGEVTGLASRGPIASLMGELGYVATKGKYAHWYKPDIGPNPFPGGLDTPRAQKALGRGVAARKAARQARAPKDAVTAPAALSAPQTAALTPSPVAQLSPALGAPLALPTLSGSPAAPFLADLDKLPGDATLDQVRGIVAALGLRLEIRAWPVSAG